MLKFFNKINTKKLKRKKTLKERVPKIIYKNQKILTNNLEDLSIKKLNYRKT